MKLLALDTSTEYLSLALWQDGELLVREMLAGQEHSSLILPMLKALLDEAGVSLRELDGIAFGQGPGSFTGLRIGCGVAQGLAVGLGLKVVGVCTLEALAEQAGKDNVIACLDARMCEVYHAVYQRTDSGWQALHAPGLYRPEQVPAVAGEGWHGLGSGWDSYETVLRTAYSDQMASVSLQAFPLARHIAELAAAEFNEKAVAAEHIAPLYIRNKVALTMQERA